MYIVVVNVRYFIMRISAYAHLHTLSRHYENGDSTDTMQQCYRSLSNWSRFRLWVIVSTWRTEQTTKARERERERERESAAGGGSIRRPATVVSIFIFVDEERQWHHAGNMI